MEDSFGLERNKPSHHYNIYVIMVGEKRCGDLYDIEFYQNNKGQEPVKDLLVQLQKSGKTNKECRIRAEKILTYIRVLEEYGIRAGEPYMKRILGTDLWELRPVRDRIFFFTFMNGKIVLLSHFLKKTQKTPKREIERAEKYMKSYMERSENNGK